jgi:hypothetical protein
MPIGSKTIGPSKRVEGWKNQDFVVYFSHRLQLVTGYGLKLESSLEWAGFTSRVKGFRNKLHLSPVQYKDFIDKVFDNFFVRNKFVPVFGSIVSEYVYNIVQKYCCSSAHPMYSDFEKIREELYSNSLLFKSLLQ